MKRYFLFPFLALVIVSISCSVFAQNASAPPAATMPVETAQSLTEAPRERGSESENTATPVVVEPAATVQVAACPTSPVPTCNDDPNRPDVSGLSQPVEIAGQFTYSNDIIVTYYVEQAVALYDMTGFVKRDREWELPIDSQILGFLKLDTEKRTGEYRLHLPARPLGTLVDVNPDGSSEVTDQNPGVQIFAVAYSPNLTGGPFSEGDDASRGWPSYLASTRNDAENEDEVIGGKLIIWSPDDQQFFPSGFGDDRLLFTSDDPVQPVPAGYSVIDLDANPFSIVRDPNPQVALYEPEDVAVKDFSDLSYTDAFRKMFDIARKEYAFNGIEGKQPDWDNLYAAIAPRVQEAEKNADSAERTAAYALALRDFTLAFRDGHVGLSGDLVRALYEQGTAGGYGFAVRELDEGRVIAVYVDQDGSAARAGMKVGAEILKFNEMPVSQAIEQVIPWTGPFSTHFGQRYEQARFLTRAPLNTEARVTFKNPGENERSARLLATREQESLYYTSPYRGLNPYGLPVDHAVVSEDVGYIRITSNYDDLNLIVRLFERALKTFQDNGMTRLIIDMRQNSGGANLGLAGFLYDRDIPLGQLEYYSEKTGKFEPEGLRRKVIPNQTQYRFDRIVVVVGQACGSACELETYAFSQVPEVEVIGQFPTAGVEAEVARGQFKLPEGLSLQLPTGRFTLPDGSLFLEGVGVQPTIRVPITEETVLSDRDLVLQEAYNQVIR